MTGSQIAEMLQALGMHLSRQPGPIVSIVVCGGAALNAGGFIDRPTKDVDVVAMLTSSGEAVHAEPLPDEVVEARARVAIDFGAPETWLNAQTSALLDTGSLPPGFADRFRTISYGPRLVVNFLGREDLIALKLASLAGRQIPRDLQDLEALGPNEEELERAVEWIYSHFSGEGFLVDLKWALGRLGHEDLI